MFMLGTDYNECDKCGYTELGIWVLKDKKCPLCDGDRVNFVSYGPVAGLYKIVEESKNRLEAKK